jgi:hypothetical protein
MKNNNGFIIDDKGQNQRFIKIQDIDQMLQILASLPFFFSCFSVPPPLTNQNPYNHMR